MKILGNKSKIARQIVDFLSSKRWPGQYWIEPFVGGGNTICLAGGDRIGVDIDPFIILALRLIRDSPHMLPDLVSEDQYAEAKKLMLPNGFTGYIGYALSFGGKFFGGYAREVAGRPGCRENEILQSGRAKRRAMKQSSGLQGVSLVTADYLDLDRLFMPGIPPESLIYCDPPYRGTTGYRFHFNHDGFWSWCRDMENKGHLVYVSEYSAPDDFEEVWSRPVTTTVNVTGAKRRVEKIFRLKRR